jgi:hypothetical protein
LNVLDVGTGAGYFIAFNKHHNVQGVTAHDYRKLPEFASPTPLDDDQYIVGNAEYLDLLPGLHPVNDLVVSRWTLQHLVDPLATIEQMAARVDIGGILAMDNSHFGGHLPPGTVLDAATAFTNAGFRARPGFNIDMLRHPGLLPVTVLEKVEDAPPLRFGYGYSMDDDGDWYYERL